MIMFMHFVQNKKQPLSGFSLRFTFLASFGSALEEKHSEPFDLRRRSSGVLFSEMQSCHEAGKSTPRFSARRWAFRNALMHSDTCRHHFREKECKT